jgi:site-specific DNA-cytosine methylase
MRLSHLTRNLCYPCSDQKIHPFENRVLSLREAIYLQAIMDYSYRWGPLSGGKPASDSLIRHVIGASVPPRFLELLGRHLLGPSFGRLAANRKENQTSSCSRARAIRKSKAAT